VDIVGLSLLWAALSLPVVTIGPATAALYYTVVKAFRRGEESTFRTMLRAFRDNLKRGIPVSVIAAAAALVLGYIYAFLARNRSNDVLNIVYCIYCALLFLPGGMLVCLFPMLGRFDAGVRQLLHNSLLLVLAHIPTTVLLVLLTVAASVWTLLEFYPVFFVPVLLTLLSSFLLERVFASHLSDEEKERLLSRSDSGEEE